MIKLTAISVGLYYSTVAFIDYALVHFGAILGNLG